MIGFYLSSVTQTTRPARGWVRNAPALWGGADAYQTAVRSDLVNTCEGAK